MNKKEIAEIKKQFTQDKCAITRICGCYVDHEKEKKTGGESGLPGEKRLTPGIGKGWRNIR